jgi:FG-GAP-like repeat
LPPGQLDMLESVLVRARTDHKKCIAATIIALIVLSWVLIGRASSRDARGSRPPIPYGWALPISVDLDGDYVADSVNLRSNGFDKTIDISFGNLRTSEVSFAAKSADHGKLVVRDIDGDGDLDLIWVPDHDQKTAVVLINDGKGDFDEAKDNTPYASQLNALLSGDSSDEHSLQAGHQIYSLSSSSFREIAFTEINRSVCATIRLISFAGFNAFGNRSAFLSYLRKRGPPLILS